MSGENVFDDDDIPAFLKADRDVNKIVDDLDDGDDAFDFPSLDDDEEDDVTDADIGLEPQPEETVAEPEPPKPEKPKKETKADKQAKLKAQAEPKPEPEPENKRAVPGNNSGIEAGPLRSFIERIERLEEEKKGIADDIKDVKAEAKGTGYDGKTLNRILALRKKDKAEREEEEALLHLYMFALGME